MNISFECNEFKQDNLSVWIFQKLDVFFKNGSAKYDIEFDFSGKTFSHEINFVELFSTKSKGYEWVHSTSNHFSNIADVLIGIKVENNETDPRPIYRLSFILDKATFDSYPNFDNLRCHKLSFSNTIFKKGARFRHIDVDDVLFEPRELSADATFFHREKADIDAGKLRGDKIGRIGRFKYRHQLEGDGTTFLIGMNFTERAEFTDCVLDKVQFSYLDADSLSNCFFANSIIGKAKFYNCIFPFESNAFTAFRFVENRSKVIAYPFLLMPLPILAVLVAPIDLNAIYVAFLILSPLLAILLGSILNTSYFMPLMKIFEKIINNKLFELKINMHIATGDDKIASSNISPEQNKINRETAREVYRQLKISYDESGDHQKAGEFYYSQRYWEMVGDGKGLFGFFSSQELLFEVHHIINGFGERWFRAIMWFLLTIVAFAYSAYTPNEDFISTKSTPEYFLNAYHKDNNKTSKIVFDKNKITDKIENINNSHFIEIATTNYNEDNVVYIKDENSSIVAKQIKDSNKTIYAYDNRFDYAYTSQFIPTLQNNLEVRFAHSLSKMIVPFVSEEKKWFQDRSERAYYLGFLETILLWIFFLAFVFAVKNRIRR